MNGCISPIPISYDEMKKIINYLNLKDVGWLEFLFALAPMLSGYNFRGIPMAILVWSLLLVFAFIKHPKYDSYKPLIILIVYVAIHDLVWVVGYEKNNNAYLETIINLLAIIYLKPSLSLEKIKGSLNVVSLIAIAGIVYQYTIIASGSSVRPLDLPFLTMAEERMETLSLRPSSFFMEPAAYTAFMFVPLLFSLIDKKYIWTATLIFFVFLTGSTTGLLTSFIMIGVYVVTQNLKKSYVFTMLILMGLMIFVLQNFDIFSVGVEKLTTTEAESNMRLAQGPAVVGTMRASEFWVGAFYANPYQYCMQRATMVHFYTEEVYMSTIWYMILCYGVIGLLLYLNVYWKIMRASKITLPLVVVLLVLLFSSAYKLGGIFSYTMVVLLILKDSCGFKQNIFSNEPSR